MTSVDLRCAAGNALGKCRSAILLTLAALSVEGAQGSEYSDLVQSHGPVAYWRMGETSGTTAVDTTGAHNGAYQNAVTLGGNGAIAGDTDKAATFAGGANDRVQVGAFGVAGSGITILAWIKPNGFGDDRFVAKATSTATANSHWALGLGNSTQLKTQIKISGTTQEMLPAVSTMSAGVWYFVVMTYDGSTMRVYHDGVQVGSAAYAGTVSNDSVVAVGLGNQPSGAGNRAFNGALDEIAVFDKALTAAQISELFAAADGGLRGHWKLNETSGTTTADSSIYARNGAITGAATWTTRCDATGALELSGSGNYVTVTNATNLQITGKVSMAAWVRGDIWGTGTDVDTIIRKGAGSPQYRLAIADGRVQARFQPAAASAAFLGNTVLATNRWYHVAATWDGSFVRIYVDGKLDNTPAAHSTLASNNQALFLGGYTGGSLFDGKLHDVRLYNRDLSHLEIANIYGQIGHWQFVEGTGAAAADSSGVGNNATLNGGASWATDCVGNKALLTNGAGGVAQTAAVFDPPSEGTVAFWMQPAGGTTLQRIFGVGPDWEVRQQPDGRLVFDICGDGSTIISTTSPVNDAGRWRHIAYTFNSADDTYAIYVDGVLDASGTNPVDMVKQSSAILSFGTRTGATEYWSGALRDFRVYSRRLCATDVAELAGLSAQWNLDETSGTSVADASPWGRNGTVSGTATWTAGKVGNSLQLNGSTYATVPGLLNSPRNITCAAWVNLTAADASGADLISLGDCFVIRLNEGGSSRAYFYNGSSWVSAAVNQTFGGGWRHVAAVFDDDNNTLKFYVNGALVATTSTTASISYAGQGSSTVLGRHGNGSGSYDLTGKLDDVRVYSRALCQTQIQEIINDGGGYYQGVRILQWIEAR